MNNGWTGGQYSFFRVVFGLYLFVHFAHLFFWGAEVFSNQGILPDGNVSPLFKAFPSIFILNDSAPMVLIMIFSATVASSFFILGFKDRIAGIWMWYVLACLFGRNPLTANPSLPFMGWILIAHAAMPSAPYGSWAGKARTDPKGGWFFPKSFYLVIWIIMSLAYTYSGCTKLVSPSWVDGTAFLSLLENPLARDTFLRVLALDYCPLWFFKGLTWGALALEVLFAPLALFRKTRPWIWAGMLGMHMGLIILVNFADLSLGMVVLHLFTFNPDWIKAPKSKKPEIVFYDGGCGLCQRTIRFILSEEKNDSFQFSPLQGEYFKKSLPGDNENIDLESIVVLTDEGTVLRKSTAIAHILKRLGGFWGILGIKLTFMPIFIRDSGYNFIAKIRYKLFAKPKEVCPLIPDQLRKRFIY